METYVESTKIYQFLEDLNLNELNEEHKQFLEWYCIKKLTSANTGYLKVNMDRFEDDFTQVKKSIEPEYNPGSNAYGDNIDKIDEVREQELEETSKDFSKMQGNTKDDKLVESGNKKIDTNNILGDSYKQQDEFGLDVDEKFEKEVDDYGNDFDESDINYKSNTNVQNKKKEVVQSGFKDDFEDTYENEFDDE